MRSDNHHFPESGAAVPPDQAEHIRELHRSGFYELKASVIETLGRMRDGDVDRPYDLFQNEHWCEREFYANTIDGRYWMRHEVPSAYEVIRRHGHVWDGAGFQAQIEAVLAGEYDFLLERFARRCD